MLEWIMRLQSALFALIAIISIVFLLQARMWYLNSFLLITTIAAGTIVAINSGIISGGNSRVIYQACIDIVLFSFLNIIVVLHNSWQGLKLYGKL